MKMNKLYFLLLILFVNKVADCQLKVIAPKGIERLWRKELFCIDSLGIKRQSCDLGLNTFRVNFTMVNYDNKTKELRLVGRLVLPIPEVGLYLTDSDTIQIKHPFAYTTDDSTGAVKAGYFDISLVVKPKESLFFYLPNFYVRQYELYKLLDSKTN
jgi:hypothetical protein